MLGFLQTTFHDWTSRIKSEKSYDPIPRKIWTEGQNRQMEGWTDATEFIRPHYRGSKKEGTGCVISNIEEGSKSKDIMLNSNSTTKEKIISFSKDWKVRYTDIDTIINESEVLDYLNIAVKVIKSAEVVTWNGLQIQEHLITDNGVNTIKLTVFGESVDKVSAGTTY